MMPTMRTQSLNGVAILHLEGPVATGDLEWLKQKLTEAGGQHRGRVAMNIANCQSFNPQALGQFVDFLQVARDQGLQFRLFSARDVERLGLDVDEEIATIICENEAAALAAFN